MATAASLICMNTPHHSGMGLYACVIRLHYQPVLVALLLLVSSVAVQALLSCGETSCLPALHLQLACSVVVLLCAFCCTGSDARVRSTGRVLVR